MIIQNEISANWLDYYYITITHPSSMVFFWLDKKSTINTGVGHWLRCIQPQSLPPCHIFEVRILSWGETWSFSWQRWAVFLFKGVLERWYKKIHWLKLIVYKFTSAPFNSIKGSLIKEVILHPLISLLLGFELHAINRPWNDHRGNPERHFERNGRVGQRPRQGGQKNRGWTTWKSHAYDEWSVRVICCMFTNSIIYACVSSSTNCLK